MYVLSWRPVSALTHVLFWCLFPSLLLNSGNKHQNNALVSAETVRHSSTYIILYNLFFLYFDLEMKLASHNKLLKKTITEVKCSYHNINTFKFILYTDDSMLLSAIQNTLVMQQM